MRLEFRPLLNPAADQGGFFGADRKITPGRRHPLGRIRSGEPAYDLALAWVAGFYDEHSSGESLQSGLFRIKPQFGHPGLRIGTVAGEAAVREQGPDLEIEVHLFVLRASGLRLERMQGEQPASREQQPDNCRWLYQLHSSEVTMPTGL